MMVQQRSHKGAKVRRLVHEQDHGPDTGVAWGRRLRLLEKRYDRLFFRIIDTEDTSEFGDLEQIAEKCRRSGQPKIAAAISRMRQEAHQQAQAGAVNAADIASVQHEAEELTQPAVDGRLQHPNFFAGDDPPGAPEHIHRPAVTGSHRQRHALSPPAIEKRWPDTLPPTPYLDVQGRGLCGRVSLRAG